MNIRSLVLVLVVFSGSVFGQTSGEIVLKGKAAGFAGQTVSVFEYEDFFTKTRVEAQNAVMGKAGEFVIKRALAHPLYIEIVLSKKTSELYVRPGFVYELVFDKDGVVTGVISKDGTNAIIADYARQRWKLWDSYHEDDSMYMLKLTEFVAQQKEKMKHYGGFAKTIMSYRVADHELFLYSRDRNNAGVDRLEKELFLDKPVNYTIPDYMSFLRHYSARRADGFRRTGYSRSFEKSRMNEAWAIPNDTVAQLAALLMLDAAYHNDDPISKARINALTDSLAHAALTPAIRKSAELFFRKNNALSAGAQIKDFAFETYQGQVLRLSAFKDMKYVLIDFWFIGCSGCVENFPSLQRLKEAYPDKLEIVSLTPYDTKEKIAAFLKKRPQYAWMFSAIDKKSELLDYFNVMAYPTYYLIAPDGKLVKLLEHSEEKGVFEQTVELIH